MKSKIKNTLSLKGVLISIVVFVMIILVAKTVSCYSTTKQNNEISNRYNELESSIEKIPDNIQLSAFSTDRALPGCWWSEHFPDCTMRFCHASLTHQSPFGSEPSPKGISCPWSRINLDCAVCHPKDKPGSSYKLMGRGLPPHAPIMPCYVCHEPKRPCY